jgi:hypothetical protein
MEGMAKQYPFVLDPFQETAIACLVGGGVDLRVRAFKPAQQACGQSFTEQQHPISAVAFELC